MLVNRTDLEVPKYLFTLRISSPKTKPRPSRLIKKNKHQFIDSTSDNKKKSQSQLLILIVSKSVSHHRSENISLYKTLLLFRSVYLENDDDTTIWIILVGWLA